MNCVPRLGLGPGTVLLVTARGGQSVPNSPIAFAVPPVKGLLHARKDRLLSI